MRPRALLAACLVALAPVLGAGCVAAAPVARVAAPPEDDATALASMLPGGDSCRVARPALLPDRRRSLVVHATHADPLAFASTPRVSAYATASARMDDGRVARVTLLRLSEPVAASREALREALPLRVRFADERCMADECDLPVAELLDARTLRIVRGAPPAGAGGSPCLDLALAHPRALELSVSTGGCHARDDRLARTGPSRTRAQRALPYAPSGASTPADDRQPCEERQVISADEDGLRIRQQLVMRDAERAQELEEAFAQVDEGSQVERRGDTLTRTSEQSWDALSLALEDERIERTAIARRQASRRSTPVDRVDVTRLAVVRQQIRLREDALGRARGADSRRVLAQELVDLIARALEVHPDEIELARRLVRLRLDLLGDPRGALEVARPIAARGEGDAAAWSVLMRECLVAVLAAAPADAGAADEAARALVAASIALDDATAHAAARDLVAITAAGVDYEIAEATWAHAREATQEAIPLAPVARGSGIPLSALPAALVWLAELEGLVGPFSTSIVVRGASAEGRAARVERGEEAITLRIDGLPDGPALAGHAASNDALLRLGATLEPAVAPGAVIIDVTLLSLAGTARVRARLAGELANGRLRIDRADAASAARPWTRVERYLAEPLRGLGARVFPPPDLVVVASDEDDAIRLARVADGQGDARCAAHGVEVRCAARSDGAPFDALRAIARAALFPTQPPPGR